jgi:hypothetical protein
MARGHLLERLELQAACTVTQDQPQVIGPFISLVTQPNEHLETRRGRGYKQSSTLRQERGSIQPAAPPPSFDAMLSGAGTAEAIMKMSRRH